MKRITILAFGVLCAHGANAQIISVTGGQVLSPAPTDVTDGAVVGPEGFVFLEREEVAVADLDVDHDGTSGTYGSNSDLIATSLNGTYSSYLLHFDSENSVATDYDMTVTFGQTIVGVIPRGTSLRDTDDILGNPDTDYPGGTQRGWEPGANDDQFVISADQKSIQYTGRVSSPLDSVRVLTEPVPEPTTVAAMGIGALALLRRKRRK
jgi:hypothetical protein